MPIRCLTAGRFTMSATILHQTNFGGPVDDGINLDKYGSWQQSQDPLTHEIVRVWVPTKVPDYGYDGLPSTPDDGVEINTTVPVLARGIVDGGIRVAGTTERFGDSYENIDFVKMWMPPNIRVSKRDRITNIRDPRGHIIWNDEEFTNPLDPNDIAKATVFNVNGVTPLLDAFNRPVEQFVLLQRASVRGEGAN